MKPSFKNSNKKHSLLQILCFFILGINTLEAQTFCLNYNIIAITPNDIIIKLTANSGTPFNLGTSNLVFSYNNAALQNPVLLSNILNSNYQPTTLTNINFSNNTSLVSVNIVYNYGTKAGIRINAYPTEIALIKFDIKNNSFKTGFNIGLIDLCVAYSDENIVPRNRFVIGTNCPNLDAAFPLQWVRFEAQLVEGFDRKVVLDWETAAEKSMKYYTVERSIDSTHFAPISKTFEATNLISQNKYQFTDLEPLRGFTYYRIQGVDSAGKPSFSWIRPVIDNAVIEFKVYPNLVESKSPLLVVTNYSETFEFLLADMSGRIIYRADKLKGRVTELSELNLADGVYLYTCKTPFYATYGKIVVAD